MLSPTNLKLNCDAGTGAALGVETAGSNNPSTEAAVSVESSVHTLNVELVSSLARSTP